MASSTDTMGPMAKTVADVAEVFDVYAGPDPLDSTTIARDPKGYLLDSKTDLKGKKIGLIKQYMGDGVDEGVKQVVKNAVQKMKDAGAVVEEVDLPSLPLALAVYYIIVPAEVSSNLSRYDGQRFGFSAPDAKDLTSSYVASRSQGFGAEAKRRIMIGTYVLSSGYYDAYYKKAQTVRTKLINEFQAAFDKFDFVIGPVAPTPAFKIGENTDDPLKMYLSDVMTVAANLVGIPAISLPAGKSNDLPVGLQVMAPYAKDRDLLQISAAIEEKMK